MNGKQLFNVGARLLGVWFVVQGLVGIPVFIAILAQGHADATHSGTEGIDQATLVLIRLTGQAILVISGLVLLIRHRLSADPIAIQPINSTPLTIVGLRLLGVGMALPATIDLIERLMPVFQYASLDLFQLSIYLKPALTIAFGLILALRPEAVMRRITRSTDRSEFPANNLATTKDSVAGVERS